MYVCMHICTYVCVCVYIYMYVCVCMYVCFRQTPIMDGSRLCRYVCVYGMCVCVCICVYVCVGEIACVCMSVHVCETLSIVSVWYVYVCLYVCVCIMYVYVCVYVCVASRVYAYQYMRHYPGYGIMVCIRMHKYI
jgi:hypothetical protein